MNRCIHCTVLFGLRVHSTMSTCSRGTSISRQLSFHWKAHYHDYRALQTWRLTTHLPTSIRLTQVSSRSVLVSRQSVLSSCPRLEHHWMYHQVAAYTTSQHRLDQVQPKPDPQGQGAPEGDKPALPAKQLGLLQRFHKAYKEYGKILVGVHLVTSAVWFGCFYYAAASGLDIVPILEKMGASETIIKPFKSTGLGNVAVAYLLYKLATPARYTVTIVGTQQTARYLKKTGYIKPIAEQDKLRSLMKEGSDKVRSRVQQEARDRREKFHQTVEEQRDRMQERRQLLERSVRKLKKRQGIGLARRRAARRKQ